MTLSGYRPLSEIVNKLGVAYFSSDKTNPIIWFAAVGSIIGLCALTSFCVSRRFLHHDVTALFSVFLLLFSTPFITGSWIVFAGIQALVPLTICLGLILYWKSFDECDSVRTYLFRVGLICVLLVGPWIREFIGILPLLLVCLEWQRKRRLTVMMGVAMAFFLHAVFPTFVVKVIAFPDLPARPIFSLGSLGRQMSLTVATTDSILSQALSAIRWTVPVDFLTLYPPLMLIGLLIVLMMPLLKTSRMLMRSYFAKSERTMIGSEVPLFAEGFGFSAVFFFIFLTLSLINFPNRPFAVALWLCAGFIFLGASRNGFLSCWFALSFIPFLRVFTEQVHLAYALLPASIIAAAALENLWGYLRYKRFMLRIAFVGVMIIVLVDHSLNLYGSYRTVHGINRGILSVSEWLKGNVPKGSIVITNALHAEDIRLFSNAHVNVYWTVQAGIPHPSKAVDNPHKLAALLENNKPKRNVYFLDIDFPYTPEKVGYHSHQYVRNQSVEMQDLGVIYTTRVHYPYLDPLKSLVARTYTSFMGAPDLENDFYRGPAQDGSFFLREVYAEYHLYKVVSTMLKKR
jgi:hypothetical protein